MNRIIKFRGKRVDNGEWIEGDLITLLHQEKGSYICNYNVFKEWCEFKVIPETLGQYTGLDDKNGKEIFEGDILSSKNTENMTVNWNEDFASWCLYAKEWAFAHWFGEAWESNQCIVVDNIYNC